LVTMHANEEAIPGLLQILITTTAAETDLRAACWQALLKLRALDAIVPAATFLDSKASTKAEIPERNSAVRILGELAREQTRNVLQRIAQSDSNPETRALAASYL
jgi:HEAT repeat protein